MAAACSYECAAAYADCDGDLADRTPTNFCEIQSDRDPTKCGTSPARAATARPPTTPASAAGAGPSAVAGGAGVASLLHSFVVGGGDGGTMDGQGDGGLGRIRVSTYPESCLLASGDTNPPTERTPSPAGGVIGEGYLAVFPD